MSQQKIAMNARRVWKSLAANQAAEALLDAGVRVLVYSSGRPPAVYRRKKHLTLITPMRVPRPYIFYDDLKG